MRRQRIKGLSALNCLVCGVDSRPVLTFFFWLVGAGLLATICLLIWGFSTKKFQTDAVRIPLEVEDE